MRLGFSTQEAYFTILGVLIVLSAIGTIIGNWLVSRAQGNETRLNNLRVVNSRVRASWPLLIVFAIAFCLGEAALLIFLRVCFILCSARIYCTDSDPAP